jgi:hypothetical protein
MTSDRSIKILAHCADLGAEIGVLILLTRESYQPDP